MTAHVICAMLFVMVNSLVLSEVFMPTLKIWVKKSVLTASGTLEIGLGGEHDVHCESHQVSRERAKLYQSYRMELERLLECERTGAPLVPHEREIRSEPSVPEPEFVSRERSLELLAELQSRLVRRGREKGADVRDPPGLESVPPESASREEEG